MRFLFIIIVFLTNTIGESQDTLYLKVDGGCEMCQDRIEGIANNTIGVTYASYSIQKKELKIAIENSNFNKEELTTKLLEAGHDTEGQNASNEAYEALPACCHYRSEKASNKSNKAVKADKTISFIVQGNCGLCHDRIEDISKKEKGVFDAHWNVDTKLLELKINSEIFDQNNLEKRISAAGHDTQNMKAPDLAYLNLPQCCQYRSENLSGLIFEKVNKSRSPLVGATVHWLNHPNDGTTTDIDGGFNLTMTEDASQLIISYIGYNTDTIYIEKPGHIEIVLDQGVLLDQVNVTYRRKSTEISYINPINVKSISQKELTKAACCNLSESFSTNPSVDVSFTDAITGTRQIEMLGLSGPYVQITRENMPDIRGLSVLSGFTYVPGPWIESIQLNLGAGSVINGFESIAGQINLEIKKPWDKEYFYLNGYGAQGGRYEGNAIVNSVLNPKWQSNLLLHYNIRKAAHDKNFDGFLDMPKGNSFIASNNYKFNGENGNEGMFGWKYTHTDQTGGQDESHHEGLHPPGYVLWKSPMITNRAEAWMKRGKIFASRPYSSLGFQLSATYHDQKATFGIRTYDARQKMLYANLIYQTIIKDTNHKISMGTSLQAEKYNEALDNKTYNRDEITPGIFGEYTFTSQEKFNLVIGLRADHHNDYGLFFTPRFHSRYAINESTVLRASLGRGQRTSNIFAENIGFLASSRTYQIKSKEISASPYGLEAEIAWNFGLNLTKDFNEILQGLSWSFDLYHTKFENQIVADYDTDVRSISFYNLDGKSYSTSIQTQIEFTVLKGLDIRIAYRYNDVKTTYGGKLLMKPLSSPHRSFMNLAYETQNGWKFDYTVNWQSRKRLPSTLENPLEYRALAYSPDFFVHDAQITKSFGKVFELYSGIENLFNFRQKKAIISAGEPFSPYFDSTLVWGPIFGSNIYLGFRYKLTR